MPKANSGGASNAHEVVDDTRDDLTAVDEPVDNEESVEPDPEAAKQKAKEARAALKEGDHDKATALLDEAAELHPERAEHFAGLKQKVAEAAEAPEVEKEPEK